MNFIQALRMKAIALTASSLLPYQYLPWTSSKRPR